MNDVFISGFGSMLGALGRIFIVIIAAGFLVRKKIISQKDIESLSKITVIVLLPCLAFAKTIESFTPEGMPFWWLLPLVGIALSLLGVFIAFGVFAPFFSRKKNLAAVASMQNAGYLVLPVGQVLYPEQFSEFALITFLFILGFNPILWTLGKYLVTSSSETIRFSYRSLFTPPAVANILSLLLVLTGISTLFPPLLIDSVSLVGDAAVPIATFVLGATLGSVSLRLFPSFWDNLRVLLIKYVLLPLLVVLILLQFDIGKNYPLLADFFVIQASAAPAAGLILQVRTYGGEVQKVAGSMIISYLFCLLAMPFWIAFWHYIQ